MHDDEGKDKLERVEHIQIFIFHKGKDLKKEN